MKNGREQRAKGKVKGEIKICGLTNLADALWAFEQGADYLGFVLYRRSVRGIEAQALREICKGLPREARVVAVVVNEDAGVLQDLARACPLHAIQYHGDEDGGTSAPGGVETWRAVRLEQGVWNPDPESWKAERFVMDAGGTGYGGSGTVIDWNAARDFAGRRCALLAGGLGPQNVAEAIRAVRPFGVDVASGVEAAPGRKDGGKVAEFISVAREAFRAAGVRERNGTDEHWKDGWMDARA